MERSISGDPARRRRSPQTLDRIERNRTDDEQRRALTTTTPRPKSESEEAGRKPRSQRRGRANRPSRSRAKSRRTGTDNSVIRTDAPAAPRKGARIAELEKSSAPKPIEIGEKPTMASCEFDEERTRPSLTRYKERKAAADRQTESRPSRTAQGQRSMAAGLGRVRAEEGRLEFEDRDEAIETVSRSLDAMAPGGDRQGRTGPGAVPLRAVEERGQARRTRQDPRPNQAGGCCRPHGRSSESDQGTQGAGT
jgi:hypothetical protein